MATAQIQNNPVYLLPFLYIQGMNISVAGATTIAIAPGQCRDSNDIIDMPIGYPNLQGNTYPTIQYNDYIPPILINATVNGANGLDQGTLAASTQYAIWVIGDSRGYNNVAGLLSLTSNAAPLLPLGYDSLRLLGFIATTSGSVFTALVPQQFAANGKAFYLSPVVSVLSGGNSTTFATINLSSAIPTTTTENVIAYLLIVFTPASVGDYLQIRPQGSSATGGLNTIIGATAGVAQSQYLSVICGVGSSVPEIQYLVSSASDSVSISVAGYAYDATTS